MIQTARRTDPDSSTGRSSPPGDTVSKLDFREFCSPVDSWSPAINLYRLCRRLEVCVDLAGVEPETVSVCAESGRLTIQGVRQAPQPPADLNEVMCIVSMEIDHGPFCRTVSLPQRVEHMGTQIQYTQGFLWIRMPVREAEDTVT